MLMYIESPSDRVAEISRANGRAPTLELREEVSENVPNCPSPRGRSERIVPSPSSKKDMWTINEANTLLGG